MKLPRFALLLAFGWLFLGRDLAAVPIKFDGEWVVDVDANGQKVKEIMIVPLRSDGSINASDRLIQRSSPVLATPGLIQVRLEKDNRPVAFERVIGKTEKDDPASPLKKLVLKIKDPKAADQKVKIVIDETPDNRPGLTLAGTAGAPLEYDPKVSVNAPSHDTTDMGATRFDLSDFNQNFISVLTGSTDGAIVSGKLNASFGRVMSAGAFDIFLRAKANADVKVTGKDVAGYFNSVVAEANAFIEHQYDRPIEGAGTEEIGIRSRFESDRAFQTINGTFGLAYWFTVDNGFTRGLNHLLYLSPDGKKRSLLAPVVVLGYDYVAKLQRGGGQSAPAFETSRHRISGHLDWPFEIVNAWDLSKTPLGATYDIDLLVEVTPIYDLIKGKALVEEKISLEIIPATDKNKASVIITYANGKATPTFQNVNTILAGLKVPF
jgi:hypothetical protein